MTQGPKDSAGCFSKLIFILLSQVSTCAAVRFPACSSPLLSSPNLTHLFRALAATEIGKAWLTWCTSAVPAHPLWHCPPNPPLHPSPVAEPQTTLRHKDYITLACFCELYISTHACRKLSDDVMSLLGVVTEVLRSWATMTVNVTLGFSSEDMKVVAVWSENCVWHG